MKLIIIVLFITLFPFSILKSQSDKNIWLEKVDPKLLEKVDLNKIPNAPNKLNSKGNRDGRWVIWLSKSHDETTNPDFVYLYRKLEYKNGVVTGKVEDFYLDGTLAATGKIKNNKFDGEVVYFNNDGKKQKIETYKNGKLNGDWIKYANNKVAVKGAFENGKRTGKWEGFHENGERKFSGEYIDGLKTYTWTYWDNNKKIKNKRLYIKDVEVSPKEAVSMIDNMIFTNEIEEASKVNGYYKEVIAFQKGEESTEYLDGLLIDSKIFISRNEDEKAIEVLNKLIDSKKVSVYTLHSSLISLNRLYKETNQLNKSKEVLNTALTKVESGESVLPFERNIVIDELADIYIQQEDFSNLELVIQKANLDEITKTMRVPNGIINYLKDNLNDETFRKRNILKKNKIFLIDTRITELAHKDILLSESKQVEKNKIINKVVQLYNYYNTLKNLDSFVKQYNPQNKVLLIERNILDSLVKKYDIRFK